MDDRNGMVTGAEDVFIGAMKRLWPVYDGSGPETTKSQSAHGQTFQCGGLSADRQDFYTWKYHVPRAGDKGEIYINVRSALFRRPLTL